MWPDVVDLDEFYKSRLGQVARRLIRRRIRDLWPDLHGLTVLGLGYATPYLRPFLSEAARVLAVMPAQQGVIRWPEGVPGLVCLSEETELPLPDLSVDRLLLVHAVEHSETLRPMLREAWRVLAEEGRLVIVVPNRRGIWARFEHQSPFGHGHPYSHSQLRQLLRDSMFTLTARDQALFVPPSQKRLVLHSAPAFEKIGNRWFQVVAGVLIVEAAKQIYGVTPVKAQAVRRRPLIALPGREVVARRLSEGFHSRSARRSSASSVSGSSASMTRRAVS